MEGASRIPARDGLREKQLNGCILLSSCEQYRPLTELTRRRLAECWQSHPPLYICGLEKAGDDEQILPLRGSAANWMRVVRSAVDDLEERGFAWCYLILEDHPPLGRCNARFLNGELPRLLFATNAAVISLHGWGQSRSVRGELLGPQRALLERNAPEFLWKFSLHPALWDLRSLRRLLDALIDALPEKEQTPWKFERCGGAVDGPAPIDIKTATYRVAGVPYSVMPAKRAKNIAARAARAVCDVTREIVRACASRNRAKAFETATEFLYHYYDGPYPLFYSGIMKYGAVNTDLLRYLRLTRRHDLLKEITDSLVRVQGKPRP
jgi:hypothetical protein